MCSSTRRLFGLHAICRSCLFSSAPLSVCFQEQWTFHHSSHHSFLTYPQHVILVISFVLRQLSIDGIHVKLVQDVALFSSDDDPNDCSRFGLATERRIRPCPALIHDNCTADTIPSTLQHIQDREHIWIQNISMLRSREHNRN